jgi:hypothetical protein
MITKGSCTAFINDMEAALQAVYAKHGLVSSGAKVTATQHTFKVSFELGEAEFLNGTNPIYYKGLARHGGTFGLITADLGKAFSKGDQRYVFRGLNITGQYAVCSKDGEASNTLYKLAPVMVRELLDKELA